MKQATFKQTGVYSKKPPKTVQNVESETVVVELTSKRYKLMMLSGDVLIYGSIAFTFWLFTETAQKLLGWGLGLWIALVLFAVGIILGCTGRFLAWWNHG
ncbi:hypothetical protein H6770_02810 [Candidatus Peribacteria bacterium]|nr:hypothetical protein [Candidatus Peribacteria bacterium]